MRIMLENKRYNQEYDPKDYARILKIEEKYKDFLLHDICHVP